MRELNQDEEYDESELEEGEDLFDESDEDTDAPISTIYGIPKNVFFIGVVVVVLLFIIVIVFATRKNKADNNAVTPTTDYAETVTEDTGGLVATPVDDGGLVASQIISIYDSNQTFIGTTDSLEGSDVYGLDGVAFATFSPTSGNVQCYDSNNNFVGYYSTSTETTEIVDEETLTTTEELRKLGYTGDEIEVALESGTDIQTLVDAAEALRDAEAQEALIRMSDSASEEFRTLVNNSIYCMPEYFFSPINSTDEGSYVYDQGVYTVNADYEKMPVYGYQLTVKCKIANGTYIFYTVDPTRWQKMPDTGNIILQVSYELYGAIDTPGFYITKVAEISTTDLTVNPEDSGVDLQDVLGTGGDNELKAE